MFAKEFENMQKAALVHVNTLRNLGLTRLSNLLTHMAACVDNKDGKGNKILYLQYCRLLNIEL